MKIAKAFKNFVGDCHFTQQNLELMP